MKHTKYYCDLCGGEIFHDNALNFQFDKNFLEFIAKYDIDDTHKNCLISLQEAFVRLIDAKKDNILPEKKK